MRAVGEDGRDQKPRTNLKDLLALGGHALPRALVEPHDYLANLSTVHVWHGVTDYRPLAPRGPYPYRVRSTWVAVDQAGAPVEPSEAAVGEVARLLLERVQALERAMLTGGATTGAAAPEPLTFATVERLRQEVEALLPIPSRVKAFVLQADDGTPIAVKSRDGLWWIPESARDRTDIPPAVWHEHEENMARLAWQHEQDRRRQEEQARQEAAREALRRAREEATERWLAKHSGPQIV